MLHLLADGANAGKENRGKKEEVCYQETKADGDDDSGGYGDSGEIEVTQVAGECLS